MRCHELVGREAQAALLREAVVDLASGHGRVLVLVGEAGAGKTRLLHEVTYAAAAQALTVLTGRAVPGDSAVPYRPLTDALLPAFRDRPAPDDPGLAGFGGQLARLVPGWGVTAPVEDSPVLVGEALARLLALQSGGRGCVLCLEDLHWADPETVAILDYLADALTGLPVLCVATSRPEGADAGTLARIERRRHSALVPVGPLSDAEVDRMVVDCLRSELDGEASALSDPPAGLTDFVRLHSDGNPFVVEELLTGLAAVGELQVRAGRWEVTGPLTPSVPASLGASIEPRIASLDGVARRVLGAAALLGRQFEWDLLPGIAAVDGQAVVAALRSAVREQLVDVGADDDTFSFRHALTREAVLAELLPPERRELAARARQAVERANPGLPGSTCRLAADLAAAAGDTSAAARLLTETARRALAEGALATAEATALRAGRVAGSDEPAVLDARDVLVEVLAAAGKPQEALSLGREVIAQLELAGAPPERVAELGLVVAQAALTAGDLDAALQALDDARRVAGSTSGPDRRARFDAVRAHVELERGDLVRARRLSRRALDGARATAQPAVECAALLVLGRAQRPTSQESANRTFEAAAESARRSGLARWELRAERELAATTFLHHGYDGLLRVRSVAARLGGHDTVAFMDLEVADLAFSNGDTARCVDAARSCIEASDRFGLRFAPVAHLWLAGAEATRGDDAAMQAAIDAALAPDPDDPRIRGDLLGRVLVSRAAARDELPAMTALLDEMMPEVRRSPPGTSLFPGRFLWALLHAVDDDDGGAAVLEEHAATAGRIDFPLFTQWGRCIDAVVQGRQGRPEAGSVLDAAYRELTRMTVGQLQTRVTGLVVARAAMRDGWGDPVPLLRGCEAWFAAQGLELLVRRSRSMLGEAGQPVPRRGRGDSEVPESLRALGVTSREVDVLVLVVDGRTTKEIAATLYLSPKTVERHLTSLFQRTGAPNRRALASLGEEHLR
jgi:DNA-binding CsgD family transcriptional regulator